MDRLQEELNKRNESWDGLARAVAARVGDSEVTGQYRSLANRLRDTDRGDRPSQWWRERPQVVQALADELAVDPAEVQRWFESSAAPDGEAVTLPVLDSLGPLDLQSPPPGLWSPELDDWVSATTAGFTANLCAWHVVEPAVQGLWIARRVKTAGWTKAPSVVRAIELANLGDRVVVSGDVPWTSAPSLSRGAILVLSTEPAPLLSTGPRRRRWSQGSDGEGPAIVQGWTVLQNEPWDDALDGAFEWFNLRSKRPADLGAINTWFEPLGDQISVSPSEMLIWLNQEAHQRDPVDGWLHQVDADPELLMELERNALRDGLSHERHPTEWTRLVPWARPEGDLFATARALHVKGRKKELEALLSKEPEIVVRRLCAAGVLRPGQTPGTLAVWPRWCGQMLRVRAGRALAGDGRTVGEALLAGDPMLAREAVDQLAELVRSEDLAEIRRVLRAAGEDDVRVAATEGLTLAVGFAILDGHDVSQRVVDVVAWALRAVRGPWPRWHRLLPHGDALFSVAAMGMSEWALGSRATEPVPGLGPWDDRELSDVERADLATLRSCLLRWADDGYGTDASDEAKLLAKRAVRLGSLLFAQRGVIPNTKPWFWEIQLPIILHEVAQGALRLPGRSADEVFPDHEEIKSLVQASMRQQSPDGLLAAIVGSIGVAVREDEPEVKKHSRATGELLDACSLNLSLVRDELEGRGLTLSQVLDWLWTRWNRAEGRAARDLPPVTLLRQDRREDARLVWRSAPAGVSEAIWEEADRSDELWQVLGVEQWVSWARWAPHYSRGWAHIPANALVQLLGEALAAQAYERMWALIPDAVLGWLKTQLPDQESTYPRGPIGLALTRAPSAHCPALIGPDAPALWLQHVVETRRDGWRKAWRELASRRAHTNP